MAGGLFRLMRPKQWIKGLLVLAAPLFTFTGSLSSRELIQILLALVSVTAASSAVYIFNDWRDIDRDRSHPIKQSRPLASGAVSPVAAGICAVICLIISGAAAIALGPEFVSVIILYLVLQAAYNIGLKRVAIADVFVLSSGYVIRAALGAIAIGVLISPWLYVCTALLALLVSFGKRLSEFRTVDWKAGQTRESLADYSDASLTAMLTAAAAGAAISYSVYAIGSDTARTHPWMVASIIWVYYGILRYLLLVLAKNEGGEPESLFLKDPQLVLSVVLYLITAFIAMRFPGQASIGV